jgi:hypothetical protein
MSPTNGEGNKRSFGQRWLWAGISGFVLVAGFLIYVYYWFPQDGLVDIFGVLKQTGYTPNIGFSGLFRPGNIIQVAEKGPDGKDRKLPSPLLVGWADKCFPGQVPQTAEFTLPQTQRSSAAGLKIGGEALGQLVPALKIESKSVADYSVTLENTRILAIAKLDLSGKFSEECVSALGKAIQGGDKAEWFQVVMQSIVADRLLMEMKWKADTSAENRKSVADEAQKAIARVLDIKEQPAVQSLGKIDITKADDKKTVISASGQVIIGYRARSIEPEYGK